MNEFSSACSDEPIAANRRVHEEGREYYERNQKAANWFAHGEAKADPRPEARLRSDAARDNAMKNRGSLGENLGGGYVNPPLDRVTHPRAVKPEAASNASGHQGGFMKNLMENYGNLEISPRRGPKVKGSEAEEYKEREQGSTKLLLDHYSTDPIPAAEQPPPPRLGHGAAEIADKHTGENMGPLMRLEGKSSPREVKVGPLHQTSQGGGWDEVPPHHRMRPEGEGIAKKNSADSIGEILLQNNTAIPQQKDAKILKHMEESPISNRMPANRVRYGGVENLEKARNRQEMSDIMHGAPNNAPVERPSSGKKVLPHLQRSELW